MPKRDIAKELIQGLEEIKAWKRGEASLKSSILRAKKTATAGKAPFSRKAARKAA